MTGEGADGAGLPWFTIVIPTYQRRAIVCDALRAIDRIAYAGRWDVVVVVDGSTDGTAAAIAGLDLTRAPQVIEQANGGLAAARNRGGRAAQGEIVLFLDDDMMVDPDILTHHAAAFAKGADAVLGDIPCDPRSPAGLTRAKVDEMVAERATRLARDPRLQLFDLLGGHVAVRRALFERIGGFDEDYTRAGGYGHEDLDFGIRMMAAGRAVFCPQAIARQLYVITPRQNLNQVFKAGFAAVHFERRHPARAHEMFGPYGPTALRTRRVYLPLARRGWAVNATAALVAQIATRAYGRWAWLDRRIRALFDMAEVVMFWGGVEKARSQRG
ncbi:MAG: hypothetical protein RIS94_575 [Pseudomonadota bacterium]|jgi:GT2 family glycosyltransferase